MASRTVRRAKAHVTSYDVYVIHDDSSRQRSNYIQTWGALQIQDRARAVASAASVIGCTTRPVLIVLDLQRDRDHIVLLAERLAVSHAVIGTNDSMAACDYSCCAAVKMN